MLPECGIQVGVGGPDLIGNLIAGCVGLRLRSANVGLCPRKIVSSRAAVEHRKTEIKSYSTDQVGSVRPRKGLLQAEQRRPGGSGVKIQGGIKGRPRFLDPGVR